MICVDGRNTEKKQQRLDNKTALTQHHLALSDNPSSRHRWKRFQKWPRSGWWSYG